MQNIILNTKISKKIKIYMKTFHTQLKKRHKSIFIFLGPKFQP